MLRGAVITWMQNSLIGESKHPRPWPKISHCVVSPGILRIHAPSPLAALDLHRVPIVWRELTRFASLVWLIPCTGKPQISAALKECGELPNSSPSLDEVQLFWQEKIRESHAWFVRSVDIRSVFRCPRYSQDTSPDQCRRLR